ncbi:hypothetical protein Tco_0461547 [Tanacetum coccineum]
MFASSLSSVISMAIIGGASWRQGGVVASHDFVFLSTELAARSARLVIGGAGKDIVGFLKTEVRPFRCASGVKMELKRISSANSNSFKDASN